ncbi:MAG TPA: hypothetical protein EYP67_05965, partial [Methanosarcinales archaeon]|nr:hypothetical protein [Methanosarcinales archaeon]
MDSFYEEQTWFRNKINAKGLIYIADIQVNTRFWLNKPEKEIPERKGDLGRIPTKEKMREGEPHPIEVRDLKNQLEDSEWSRFFIRDTERKELWSNIACVRVYPVV